MLFLLLWDEIHKHDVLRYPKELCMENVRQCCEISEKVWARLAPHLPGRAGQRGGVAKNNRLFICGVFWILRTGARWSELPPHYGKWNTVHQRFRRWRLKGVWEKILELLIDEAGYDWLMVNAGHERYPWPWLRMVCRSEILLAALPRRIIGQSHFYSHP
jgi:transposase